MPGTNTVLDWPGPWSHEWISPDDFLRESLNDTRTISSLVESFRQDPFHTNLELPFSGSRVYRVPLHSIHHKVAVVLYDLMRRDAPPPGHPQEWYRRGADGRLYVKIEAAVRERFPMSNEGRDGQGPKSAGGGRVSTQPRQFSIAIAEGDGGEEDLHGNGFYAGSDHLPGIMDGTQPLPIRYFTYDNKIWGVSDRWVKLTDVPLNKDRFRLSEVFGRESSQVWGQAANGRMVYQVDR